MRLRAGLCFLLLFACAPLATGAQVARAVPGDTDQTLRAMRDELQRSVERLRIEGLEPPYYIEYRLLDVDIRSVTASFGALITSSTARNRLMAVDVRVGDYQLDSSNFLGAESFQGFVGSTGSVGIDRDYDSLRQDLWLATDQAYKQALDRLARKRAYIRNLARTPDIPDFSRERPLVLLNPLVEPDWTSRDWEAEARQVSAVLRNYPQLHDARVTYHLIHFTYYLMNSEGTQIRVSRSVAGIEAAANTQSPDTGMPLHHLYTAYALRPADLPPVERVQREVERMALELVALRSSPLAEDYLGPVLFAPQAAGALLAQLLAPSVSGARSPLSQGNFVEQLLERFGGRSEWLARMNTRVLPANVSLIDDPTVAEFRGEKLLGHYEVDDQGVRAQRVAIVEGGVLRDLLMSRRPGQHSQRSNGHARSVFLQDPQPVMSNLFFESTETKRPEELKSQFLELCRAEGRRWCILVRAMDNPMLAAFSQEDSFQLLSEVAAGAASGDRLPLLVYRVWVEDGREELIRGARLTGLNLRALRNIVGIGNDPAVFHYFQNPAPGFAGTALNAFGSVQSGLPSSVVAPSLLLEEVEVRGARGEPRRPPLLPPPPFQ